MLHCNIFKRSFSDKGFGYTFNNIQTKSMFKKLPFQNQIFSLNKENLPVLIQSPSIKHALNVLIENNMEENNNYEYSGDVTKKPRSITISLHDPKEPPNLR